MRRQSRSRFAFLAAAVAVCVLFSCCAVAVHTAGHVCFHYDNCHLCQQLNAAELLALLALIILSSCIFIRSRIHSACDSARPCVVPVTLISQFVQMND